MTQLEATTPASPAARLQWPTLLLSAALVMLLGYALYQAQQPGDLYLSITNVSHESMEVRIGGDRVRIIRPHDTEYLDLPVAVWAWPRRIEVLRYSDGERLLYWRADLNDLVDNHLRLTIP